MAAPFQARVALAGISLSNGLADIVEEQRASQRGSHLDIGETLADAAARTDAEGAEGAGGARDVILKSLGAGEGVLGAGHPALGDVAVGLGVVGLVVVDGVVGGADDGAGGDEVAFDGDAAGEDFTGENAADGGGHTHSLVDAGAEVGAGAQDRAVDDLLNVDELAADFLGHLGQSGGVADEVKQSSGHCGGSGVGSGNDTEACVSDDVAIGEEKSKTYSKLDSAQSSGVLKPWPVSGSRALRR